MSQWQDRAAKVYMTTNKRVPLTIERGKGVWVWDDSGKKYLDFVGGWAVNSLGHCHPAITKTLIAQSKKLIQTSNQFYTIPQVQLGELLVKNSCMDQVFFCNSGAEANEGAIKLARKYGKLKRNGAYEIISTEGSFHGRTLAAVAATGNVHYQENFLPMPSGFVHVPYNDIEAVMSATTEKTCAVLIEPIQGENGVIVPSKEYMQQLRKWCDEKGLLLMFDEVQTGIGRLGTLFGYEAFGVEPDVMTLAKGLGGGVPIGAFMAKKHAAVLTPGDHGTTFGGNPLACAVGYTVVDYVIKRKVLANAKKSGARLTKGLQKLQKKHRFVTEVRGQGLLQAIQFKDDISGDVLTAAIKNGLLLNAPRPNTLRFMPPLVITTPEVDEGMKRLDTAIGEVAKAKGLK